MKTFVGLPSAQAVVFAAFAVALTPPPDISVARWAEQERIVSAESGSPEPGPWRNARSPYLVEPMECLSPSHPSSEVTLVWAAQTGKSEVGVNWLGSIVDVTPAGTLVVLPAIEEALKFNRIKLQPTIEATPALRHKVREVKSRDENGSTAGFKRFRGGFIQITHAGSSKGLQAITVKYAWGDEVSEFPHDAGDRGDPVGQIRQRSSTFALRGAKHLWTSTPKLKGACRISDFYDASDRRRYYFPCPHCGDYFALRFEHLKWSSDRAPFGVAVAPPCCGALIEHWQKADMIGAGVWLKTYPATEGGDLAPADVVAREALEHFKARPPRGRQPGFHFWRGQSPWSDWESIVKDYLEAKDDSLKLKTFTQQVLAEPFEQTGEAPDHLKLLARREDRQRGVIPVGALVLTGFVDVQANRLEWAVYGWGVGLTSWDVDVGTVTGSPDDDATWRQLAQVLSRSYEDALGRQWAVEAWGIDAGYKSPAVYQFTRGRPNVLATDGLAGGQRPMIGTPKKQDFSWRGQPVKGGAVLWPLGTYPLKTALYSALQKTIDGPDAVSGAWPLGCVRFSRNCDEAFFLQITAEFLDTVQSRDGLDRRVWVKKSNQANEQLDLWVGARAMASHLGLDRYTPQRWEALVALRGTPETTGQSDLAQLWSDPLHNRTAALQAAKDRQREAALRLANLNKHTT